MDQDARREFEDLERAFYSALDLPDGQPRDAFVTEACATNPGIGEDLRELLENHRLVREAVPSQSVTLPRFGPWQAVRMLGKGGMGAVYLAERADGAFQMSAAVKVVPLAVASPQIEERFLAERQLLAHLNHPAITRLIDGGVSAAGLPYLVMEFIDGETIDRYAARGGLSVRQRVALFRQMLEALEYVHGQHVLHRDLKPSNVLVDAAGRVKLCDFGIARLIDPDSHGSGEPSTLFALTPEYASPEQLRGQAVTAASDVYSAGVLLRKLLAGAAEKIDPALDAICAKATAPEPVARFASAEEMSAVLGRYLDGRPSGSKPPKRRVALVAACIVAGGAVAGWFFSRPKPPKPPESISVLPFTNTSGDPASQYIVDGLTEELTNELQRVSGLRVTEPLAAARYKTGPRNLEDIGRRLRASYLLEADVTSSGDRLKVVASLHRTSGGSILWTNTYQRGAGDLNAIEADLAAEVRRSLGLAKPPPRPGAALSPEAHDLYLKARFEAEGITLAANAQAQTDYRQVIEMAPRFAPAYAGLAAALWNRNILAGQSAGRDELREAEHFWQKALELDPGIAAARSGLALYVMQYDWDWAHAERELRTAIASGPNMAAESTYALLCVIQGRRAEADQHLRKARDLDPEGWATAGNSLSVFRLEQRFAESRQEALKLATRNPNAFAPQVIISLADSELGDPEEGIRVLKPLLAKQPSYAVPMAWSQALGGHRAEALRLLKTAEQQNDRNLVLRNWFGMGYAALDDEANAVKWLERSMDAHEFVALYIHVEPLYAKYQDTPAFHALKKRMNLDW